MQNHIQNESEFKKIYSILSLYVFLNWPRNFFFFLDLINSIFPWLKNKTHKATDIFQK